MRLANQKQGAYIIFITLFSTRCIAFYQQTVKKCWAKTIVLCLLPATVQKMLGQDLVAELNRHILTFLHLILMCMVTYEAPTGIILQGHIRSTAGDNLSQSKAAALQQLFLRPKTPIPISKLLFPEWNSNNTQILLWISCLFSHPQPSFSYLVDSAS